MGIDSQLLFEGDAGTTDLSRPSPRMGIEWTNYARLAPSLTVDADLAFTRAHVSRTMILRERRFRVHWTVISAGLTIEPRQLTFGSLRVRHFGPRALTEDGRITSSSTTIWNGEVGYRLSSRATVLLEAFNLVDAKVSDTDSPTHRDCQASPREVSTTSTPTRLSRVQPASGSSFRSDQKLRRAAT